MLLLLFALVSDIFCAAKWFIGLLAQHLNGNQGVVVLVVAHTQVGQKSRKVTNYQSGLSSQT